MLQETQHGWDDWTKVIIEALNKNKMRINKI
jgi:hypothetical protein